MYFVLVMKCSEVFGERVISLISPNCMHLSLVVVAVVVIVLSM